MDSASNVPTMDSSADGSLCVERMFTLFPNLPTELRLKIWVAALPGPRVMAIDHSSGRWCRFDTSQRKFVPPEPLWMLITCREARNIILEQVTSFQITCFNPYKDAILASDVGQLRKLLTQPPMVLNQIRTLAINPSTLMYKDWFVFKWAELEIERAIAKMGNVEQLVMCRDCIDNGSPDAATSLKVFLEGQRENSERTDWWEYKGRPWKMPNIVSLPVLDDPIKAHWFGIEVSEWLARIGR
jgi:hypothetical protein